MSGSISYDRRFPLPDNWDVYDTVCVIVPLPRDAQYIAMFRGLLDNLTWTRSFQLHPTENAARRVADSWARALASRELEFENCGEFDVSYDLRVKPGEPWTTQFSTDGGATWHDAIIQPNWSGGAGAIVPPPTSGSAAGDVTAALLQKLWQWLCQQFETGIGSSQPKAVTVSNIMSSLAPYGAGAAVQSNVESAYDAYNALPSGEKPDWRDDCAYGYAFEGIQAHIQANPSNWLDSLAAYLFSSLDWASSTLMQSLNAAAASLGGDSLWNWTANQGGTGGGGGGAGFAGSCPFTHTFDFAVNDGGFTTLPGVYNAPPGSWSGGGAWGSALVYQIGLPLTQTDRLWIIRSFSARELTSLELHVDFSGIQSGTFPADTNGSITLFASGVQVAQLVFEPSSTGPLTFTWTGSVTADRIELNGFFNGPYPTNAPFGYIELIVEGVGLDPF